MVFFPLHSLMSSFLHREMPGLLQDAARSVGVRMYEEQDGASTKIQTFGDTRQRLCFRQQIADATSCFHEAKLAVEFAPGRLVHLAKEVLSRRGLDEEVSLAASSTEEGHAVLIAGLDRQKVQEALELLTASLYHEKSFIAIEDVELLLVSTDDPMSLEKLHGVAVSIDEEQDVDDRVTFNIASFRQEAVRGTIQALRGRPPQGLNGSDKERSPLLGQDSSLQEDGPFVQPLPFSAGQRAYVTQFVYTDPDRHLCQKLRTIIDGRGVEILFSDAHGEVQLRGTRPALAEIDGVLMASDLLAGVAEEAVHFSSDCMSPDMLKVSLLSTVICSYFFRQNVYLFYTFLLFVTYPRMMSGWVANVIC